ncbi:MAG: hypothetical protein NVSMB56_04830 [Pyrinomonadaceae bacterium]
MTTQDHNKLVAVLHLVNGGMKLFGVLIALIIMVFFGIFATLAPSNKDGAIPLVVFLVIAVVVLVITSVFTIPSFLAGYGMLNRKSWARMAGIVASCFDLLSIPLGTALGIYSLWFLLGEEGSRFYLNNQRNVLYAPPPPQSFQPPSPGDWRQ